MSRSGYTDDYGECAVYNNAWALYREAVERALYGKRGQRLLVSLVAALDAMPEQRLVSGSFLRTDGEVCALGALGRARDMDMSGLEKAARDADEDWYGADVPRIAGHSFDIARSMAAEIMYENDEGAHNLNPQDETPEARWQRMRRWAVRHQRREP